VTKAIAWLTVIGAFLTIPFALIDDRARAEEDGKQGAGSAADAGSRSGMPTSKKQLRQRGAYLATHVAMCVQCHSPRLKDGELNRNRLFHGAAIPFKQPPLARQWALEAPQIAGLPGWTGEDVVELLTEGSTSDGYEPRAPMPPYRMQPEDAKAVVAYLRSLD